MNFNVARVLIVGDVMLDQYWYGGTSRISPEAPVPVVHVDRTDDRPGGAANVALGIRALGAEPYLLGVTGQDREADILEQLMLQHQIKFHFERVSLFPTITKQRILSRNQQMIRLDRERPFLEVGELFRKQFMKALQSANVVILSDYGKGTLSHAAEWIALAKTQGVPVVVDPKSRDFSLYRGANVVKPNLKEFEAVVGPCTSDEHMIEKARNLIALHDIAALLITRSELGALIVTETAVTHIPAVAREVHDVTGAGDTVIAVLGAALGAGMDLIQAATLGNVAAGIAVSKLGAAAVSAQEIQAALGEKQTLPLGVLGEEDLLEAIRISKTKGERLVFTNGCFDILHSGHVMYLEQAKQLGDRLVVAVNTDASVSRLKGPTRPINSVENRMSVLAGLRSVDWVVPFSEDTPERIIECIAPHTLVKGGDYHDIHALPGARFVLAQGGTVEILGLKEGCSTTNVVEKINASAVSSTNNTENCAV